MGVGAGFLYDCFYFFSLKYVLPSLVEIEVGSVEDFKRVEVYISHLKSEEVKFLRHGGEVGGLLEIYGFDFKVCSITQV